MKILYKILISICFFLFFSTLCNAQTSKLNWATDSEFLPQNSIKAIVPDRYGFIWMTTENGLIRFDGSEYKIFDSKNLNLKNYRFNQIRGNIAQDSLIVENSLEEDVLLINRRFAKKIVDKYKKAPLKNTENYYICSGLPCYEIKNKKIPMQILLSSKKYYIIDNQTINLYNKDFKIIFKQKFSYKSILDFFVLDEKLFYANGNIISEITKDKIVNVKLEMPINIDRKYFWDTTNNQVFIYNNKNLYQIKIVHNKFTTQKIVSNENLMNDNLKCVYNDEKKGLIYLGSLNKGFCIIQKKQFKTVIKTNQKNNFSSIFYASVPIDSTNLMTSAGLLINSNYINEKLTFNNADYKFGIAKDEKGDIWINRYTKLYRYTKLSNYKNFDFWEFNEEINAIYCGKNNTIWFSIRTILGKKGKIYCFKSEKKPIFNLKFNIDFNINYFLEDENDQIWLGTYNGLKKITLKNNKLFYIKNTENLNVRSISISDKENIWITTYEKGFFLYNKNKLHSFPKDRNNYLLSSHYFMEDKNGYFWIPTNKGLFQVKKNSLLLHSKFNKVPVYYNYFDKNDGFITNEFNGGCEPNGQFIGSNIAMPSMNGMVFFNPNNIKPFVPNEKLYIDEAIVDNKKVAIKDTIFLAKDFERVKFFINSPYFGNSYNLSIEAKLEGPTNQNWISLVNKNTVSFTTLTQGTYKLIARKLNGFDSKYDYKTITVIVAAPFWETLWFKTLIVIIICLILYLIFKLRITYVNNYNVILEKKINEQTENLKDTIGTLRATKDSLSQQIKDSKKLIQFITHDIKTPLKYMAMSSKSMYTNFDKNDEELKENLHSIFSSSNQMFLFIDHLLEYSKLNLEKDKLNFDVVKIYDVVNEKIKLFQEATNIQKIEIVNLINKEEIISTNKLLFSIIIHNILDNAIKNTQRGNITIEAKNEDLKTFIKIKDTGKGIEKSEIDYYHNLMNKFNPLVHQKSNKLGFYIIIELLIILEAKLLIKSKMGIGTSITITFNQLS